MKVDPASEWVTFEILQPVLRNGEELRPAKHGQPPTTVRLDPRDDSTKELIRYGFVVALLGEG